MPYRPTEKTRRRAEEAREAIVTAALAQVAEGGYASASVQVVAARAGVATGSVYRHFGSKAELFAEVFRRAAGRELAVVERTVTETGGSTLERIAAAAEAFARRALAGKRLAWSQLAEPVDPAVEAERLVLRRGYRDAFARTLDEGVAAGELRPTTPPRWPPRWSAPWARPWSARWPTLPPATTSNSWPRWSSSAPTPSPPPRRPPMAVAWRASA